MTDTEISTAARAAFDAARNADLDLAAALDNAGEAVAQLVIGRPGTFDQESLTWTSDD